MCIRNEVSNTDTLIYFLYSCSRVLIFHNFHCICWQSSNIKSLNLLFSGEKITFVDYYKRQYNIVIKDLKQVSRFAGHGLSLIEIGPNETSA